METLTKKFTETNVDSAFELARAEQKPVLIDFWSTNCKGCQRMDAVTYEDASVQAYLEQHYVLVKYHVSKMNRDFSKVYLPTAIQWTPALYIYSPDGAVIRNITGYLSPRQFIIELSIGQGAAFMRKGKYAEALELLSNLTIAGAYPVLDQEAMYWSGVAAFFGKQKDFRDLVPYWGKLINTYPGSTWAEKADILPAEG
ncbi:thioredoxin family protein [Chitinophaga arvensicola]|nr:thioredoxin family protein [Chitinophaga arvensicola]